MATATTMSGPAFDQLPYEKGRHLELIQGEMIEVSSATLKHQYIVVELVGSLHLYFRHEPLGRIAPDVEFALGEDSRLRPDLAILLGERWATVNENKTPILLVPDIAVEVISPSERTTDSLRKIRIYLGAGVQEVWQVYAETQEILIYGSSKSIHALDIDDNLSTPLLPGWQVSVREIFRAKQ
jgi:Uma2 family endonuclease